jgi:transcriptional regulator with XRE-family HTH domain
LYGFPVPVDDVCEAICAEVARLLKEEREKRRLSLNLLAEKAGLSRQTITFVEQESRTPTLHTLLRITSALEVDLEKIIARARKAASKKAE